MLSVFQSVFTAPTWSKMQVLLVGTLLARGGEPVLIALGGAFLRARCEQGHFAVIAGKGVLACSGNWRRS